MTDRNLPESSRVLWLRVGSDAIKRVQMLSRVHWWHGHWSVSAGSKVKCIGLNCRFCNAGVPITIYYVVGVFDTRHGRMLFELRDRHRPLIQELHEHETGGVGTWLHITRGGSAVNAPINVEAARWEPAAEWDISALVESLGTTSQKEKSSSMEDEYTPCL